MNRFREERFSRKDAKSHTRRMSLLASWDNASRPLYGLRQELSHGASEVHEHDVLGALFRVGVI